MSPPQWRPERLSCGESASRPQTRSALNLCRLGSPEARESRLRQLLSFFGTCSCRPIPRTIPESDHAGFRPFPQGVLCLRTRGETPQLRSPPSWPRAFCATENRAGSGRPNPRRMALIPGRNRPSGIAGRADWAGRARRRTSRCSARASGPRPHSMQIGVGNCWPHVHVCRWRQ